MSTAQQESLGPLSRPDEHGRRSLTWSRSSTPPAAGDWWFEAFVIAWLGDVAPQSFDSPASGRPLLGDQITCSTLAIGWVLFGIASLHALFSPARSADLAGDTDTADNAVSEVSHQASLRRLARLAGPVSMGAAVLIVVLQVGALLTARQTAADLPHALNNVLGLVAVTLLLLALVGLYAHQSGATGRLGLAGFVLAIIGTTLLAGDWWFEAFVGPVLAETAPEVLDRPPSGLLLGGAVATFALFAIGWSLFGIASLRAGVFPRTASVLLIVGGAAGLLAGSPPFQVPLALAVGWIGLWLDRSNDRPTR